MSFTVGSVLIYGTAGARGTAIASATLAAGGRVRILLRDGRPNFFGNTVDIVRGDLGDPARVGLANLGIDKVVLSLPQLTDAAKLTAFGRNAIDAAKAAGVKLMVFNTGGPTPSARAGVAAIDALKETETYLQASEIPSIIIRPTLHMGNLTSPWCAPAVVRSGVFAYPLPADFPVSWISWEDLGSFVVEALKRPELAGRAFNIAGPEILTGSRMAEVLADVIGGPVAYVPVALEDFAAGLNAALGKGVGDEVAAHYAWFQNHTVSPLAVDVRPALADLPIRLTPFAEWAKAQDWNALASRARAA